MDPSSMEDVAISEDGEKVIAASDEQNEIQENNIPNGIEDKQLEESTPAQIETTPESQHSTGPVVEPQLTEYKDDPEKQYYDQEQ